MKKLISCSVLLLSCFTLSFAKQNLFTTKNSVINNLKWLDVSGKRLAPQIMLDFEKPFYFEKRVDEEKMQLELAFPGMDIQNFKEQDPISKIKTLGNLVSAVELYHKTTPSPRVILKITFCRKDILLRWTKLEDPNRLIVDIFLKDSLKNLKKKGAALLYAKNEPLNNNGDVINLGSPPLRENVPQNIRIVVDAGHGGSDSGAQGFFLKEKELALDIARRTKFFLKKSGFNVFLTRGKDEDLSLLERNELAHQLKADLLVSIHLNAVKDVEKVSGMETYFLNNAELLPESRYGGFAFANDSEDLALQEKADDFFNENVKLSKSLAENIHESLRDFLKSKNVNIVDRGTKKAKFRILLCSEIPVALVEVGFLTNEKEAKRLATPLYRHMLAYGISKGIQKYLKERSGS